MYEDYLTTQQEVERVLLAGSRSSVASNLSLSSNGTSNAVSILLFGSNGAKQRYRFTLDTVYPRNSLP